MNFLKQTLTIFLSLAVCCCLFAQGSTELRYTTKLVQDQKAQGVSFEAVSPFSMQNFQDVKTQRPDLTNAVEDGTVLKPEAATIRSIIDNQPASMVMSLPLGNQVLELELVRVNIFSPDFELKTSDSNKPIEVDLGVQYHGIIKGQINSIAAISITENGIMGMMSSDNGNYILGPLEEKNKDNEHILYNDLDLKGTPDFACETPDDDFGGYSIEQLSPVAEEKANGDCLRLYVEVGTDIHDGKGGVTGATNYITGLFNESFVLYANESIPFTIASMFVWTTNDPYSGSSSTSNLNTFKSQISSLPNGSDLGQYVNYAISGGVAAGFAGVCASNVDNSLCVSGIQSSYSSVPTYSWSVMVVTHEMGHLIGSRHTHACVWNGNNTAIDGCSGQTEGSCSLPGNPSGGGFIMSYCHLTSVGINFNLGFGDQSGNVIRNTLAGSSCTSPCSAPSCTDGFQNGDETGVDCGGSCPNACPSCTDGIQNGDEEGVDCGGSNCAPCPCTGTQVTLTINLDNYPEETSWDIRSGGSVVASGGTYGSQPDGSQVVEVACLGDGCYDFTIYDTYGDGICCSYGVGDYTLADGGTVLASGGAFGSSEATNFCISGNGCPAAGTACNDGDPTTFNDVEDGNCNCEGTPCPTAGTSCNDGNPATFNDVEDGFCNCSGTPCPAAGTACNDGDPNTENDVEDGFCNCAGTPIGGGGCDEVFNNFDSGWGNFSDGGSDCRRSSNDANYAYSGSYCVRLRDNTSSSVMTSVAYNLSSYNEVSIDFTYYPRSMENGEDFWLQYSANGGSSYTTYFTWARGSDFNNNTRYFQTAVLTGTFSNNARFRFRCDASSNSDWVYIDDVNIEGCTNGAGLVAEGSKPVPITAFGWVNGSEADPVSNDFLKNEAPEVEMEMDVYPNPATERVNLDISIEAGVHSAEIMDIRGRVVWTGDVQSGRNEINVSNLPAGMYYINVLSNNGKTITQKFVKS